MSLANLVRRMTDAGAPPEAIAIALEEIEAIQGEVDDAIRAARAKDAAKTRRYRERGGGAIPSELRRAIFARDNHECQECGSRDYLQCDHVHPVSKGGPTTLENLQVLCRTCNSRKKDRVRKQEVRANVHGHSEDIRGVSLEVLDRVSLDKERAPRPPKEINPIPCVQGARARGWHRLPEEWAPRALPLPVQAKVDQWPPGMIGDELAGFRRWAANAEDKNGKGRKLDWDQAWRNWIARRHDERRSNTLGRNQSPDGLSQTTRAALSVFGPSEPRINRAIPR